MELKGKVTVVTGGSSGIGKAIATKLAERGSKLAIIARSVDRLEEVKKLLSDQVKTEIYVCDVSDSKQVKETFEKISKDFGHIDYLVNNAGISTSKPMEELTEEDFDNEVAVNFKGVYLCTTYVYPLMKLGGAIVNIGSYRARAGTPKTSPAYAASKAAVINLTKSYAMQLAKYGIRVNCVSPGRIHSTGISKSWGEEKRKKLREANLLKRLGSPDDIANAVCFLLSDLASYVTGHTLDVNGGDWMN
jgi:3-oxoacyl-[acyl-carrier protein] reductase